MQITQIKNAMTYTPGQTFTPLDVSIENGRFTQISPSPERSAEASSAPEDNETVQEGVLNAAGKYLIPGLIDIHFHGCAGYDFCDGTQEALTQMGKYQLKSGVTTMCPASMSLAEETLLGICKNAAVYASDWKPGTTARLRGINLEGPFLSQEKKGAQNPEYIIDPSDSMMAGLMKASAGLVKMISIAPELPGAMDFIRSYCDQVRISLGHTACDYDTAQKAFESGASHMTHLYNGMPGLTHRAPGPIGAAFDSEDVMAEIICDGIHIHPSAVRAAFRLFGKERMVLISDSMMATGMSDGSYALGGLPVTVKGHYATLSDGTLAGSATNLFDCMRSAVSMGIPFEDAVGCATINPARAIGIDKDYGSIAERKVADCLILNEDLTLHGVVLEGTLLSL